MKTLTQIAQFPNSTIASGHHRTQVGAGVMDERGPHDYALDAVTHLGVHVLQPVEFAFGDVYGRCSCGARSTDFVSRQTAEDWRCPEGEALRIFAESLREARIVTARNLRRWVDRNNDAQCSGYRR
jgi:hypothetical protein